MSVIFVDDSPLSHAVLLVHTVAEVTGSKPVKVDDTVKNSETFKKASPEGKVPAFSGNNASVSGFFEVAKALLPENSVLLGLSDSKNVEKWLSFTIDTLQPSIVARDAKTVGNVKKANKDLASKIFVSGLNLTVADLALYAVLHPLVRGWTAEERNEHNHITRFVDTVQHQDKVAGVLPEIKVHQSVSDAPGGAPVKKDSAPTTAPAKEENKQAQNKGKPATKESAAAAQKTERKEPTAEEKEAAKKAKEDRKSKNAAARGGAAAAGETKKELPMDVSRLDIRVGKIVDVKKHESADSLYVEQIDLGEEKPRQVVSGLVKHINIEDMKDRYVVVLCNLKPSALRGVQSHAMVMCATGEQGNVELLTPPEGTPVGEKVVVDGFPGEADEQLNPKQKVFETVAPELKTNESSVACYRGVPMKTSKGEITVKSVKNGLIK